MFIVALLMTVVSLIGFFACGLLINQANSEILILFAIMAMIALITLVSHGWLKAVAG